MKKIFILLFMTIFSFYIIGNNLGNNKYLKNIKDLKEKYEVEPIDAIVKDNTIIPGKKGIKIDYQKSILAMKKYKSFNETLILTKEDKPKITINNQYNKYIEKGNEYNHQISIVFKIEKDIKRIINILNKKNIVGNFFIDESLLEKEESLIKDNKKHSFNILNNNSHNNEALYKAYVFYLNSILKRKSNFCYTEKEDNEILNNCSKLSMFTIKPLVIIKKDLLNNIKKFLSNSMIITIELNNDNERELSSSIDYILSKGYKIVSLEELIKE